MSVPPMSQPPQFPDAVSSTYPERRKASNGIGLIAMILGVVSLGAAIAAIFVTLFVRFAVLLVVVSLVFGLAGLVLGIVAVCRRGRRKGAAIAGIVLSPLAFVTVIVMVVMSAAASLGAVMGKEIKDAEVAESAVRFVISGEADTAKIHYRFETSFDSTSRSLGQRSLPYSETRVLTGSEKHRGVWQVSASSVDGKPVTCSMTVGGTVTSTETGRWVMCGVASEDGDMVPYGRSSEDRDHDGAGDDWPGTGDPDGRNFGPGDSRDERDGITS